jgi:cell division transport system permease protein
VSGLKYFFREGLKGMKRNLSTTIGTIVTIFLSLFLIGLFIFVNNVISNVTSAVEDQVSITAYISDDAAADEEIYKPVMEKIAALDGVEDVTYTSKEQALEDFKTTMKSDDIINELNGANPLPASFSITLSAPQMVESLATTIREMDDFVEICDSPETPTNSVKYGQQTVERLFSMVNIIRTIAVVFVLILIFVAFVFMNNTIRLAVMNRSREIAIERLVGASNSFIRGPFLAEGAMHAAIGAVLAIVVLQLLLTFITPYFTNSLAWLPVGLETGTIVSTYVIIFIAGIVIGLLSSSLAMRKYLKV